MLLNEKEIETFVGKARNKKICIKDVSFRYNHRESNLLVDPNGVGNVIVDNEFYTHFQEDLSSIDSFLLSRLSSRFLTDMQVDTKVLNDGYMDFKAVNVKLNITIPSKEKDNIRTYLHRRFEKIVSFYPYIQNISFAFHQFRMCNVFVEMILDLDKINAIILNKSDNIIVNNQMLGQWLGTLDLVTQCAHDEHTYRLKLPLIQGRMRFDMRVEGIRELFRYEENK